MYPCFIIGILLHQNVLFSWIKRHSIWFPFLFLFMLIFWDKQMWDRSHGIPSGILEADIETWLKIIFARLFRNVIGVVGSLTFVVCLHYIFNRDIKSKIIHTCCDWGKYSLYIYVLQRVLLEKAFRHFICMDNIGNVLYELIVTPIISALLLLFFIYITKAMSHSSVLEKWLWGKNHKVFC